jgi:outer membrane protein TolC
VANIRIILFSFSITLVLISSNSLAQSTVDYDKLVSAGQDTKPSTFEEYLVQLAWKNNPSNEALSYKVEIEKQEKSIARKEWTRNLTLGSNLNESNYPYFLVNYLKIKEIGGRKIDLTAIPSIVTYPLWNIGVGVNIGDLIVRKHKIGIADQKIKIAEADVNQQKLKIRAETLNRYQKYLSSIEILKARVQALTTADANKEMINQLFEANKANFEDVNTSNGTYYESIESKIQADLDVKIAKINIEEIVGVKWDVLERFKVQFKPSKD